jgi:hypothetical protein
VHRPAEWRSKNARSSANAKTHALEHYSCDLQPSLSCHGDKASTRSRRSCEPGYSERRLNAQEANAPVAQWIEQRFPKPRALVRFRPGASATFRGTSFSSASVSACCSYPWLQLVASASLKPCDPPRVCALLEQARCYPANGATWFPIRRRSAPRQRLSPNTGARIGAQLNRVRWFDSGRGHPAVHAKHGRTEAHSVQDCGSSRSAARERAQRRTGVPPVRHLSFYLSPAKRSIVLRGDRRGVRSKREVLAPCHCDRIRPD